MKITAVALVALLFWTTGAIAQSSPNSDDALKSINDLVKLHLNWNEKQLSTPGASVILNETARSVGQVTYDIHVNGLPRDKVYDLVQWPVTLPKPAVVLRGVTFDENGLAICAGRAGTCGTSEKANDPISFTASAVPGEPLRFAFVASDDPKWKAVSSTVPNPLRSTDNGCTIDAVLLTPRAELLVILGSGFPPGANLKMRSDSEGEVVEASPKATADGAYTTALLPAKKGLLKGIVKVRLSANQCAPELQIPWAIAPAAAK